MPKFQIEQYQSHISTVWVEAESKEDAIEKLMYFPYDAECCSLEFNCVDTTRGNPPSICSVEKIDD